MLNPPANTPIQPKDQLIIIAEDDDKIQLDNSSKPSIKTEPIRPPTATSNQPEKTLILGWNQHAPLIIHELDNYVSPGSQLHVLADMPASRTEKLQKEFQNLPDLSVQIRTGDTTSRETLENLPLESYNNIIILCYSDDLEIQEADAKTLITLLHLRDLSESKKVHLKIVSEMLDVRNRELAEVTKADDFIVSEQITSLMLSQVSENKSLNAFFADIFDADGSEIYLKPAENYVELNTSLNFYTVVEAGRQRNEVAFGYKKASTGVVVNPKKSELVSFEAGDKLILVAESWYGSLH